MMIYEYEAEILRYINQAVPNVKEMTYSSKIDTMGMFTPVTKYPAFFYSREQSNWDALKVITITDGTEKYKLAPINQQYLGKIAVENSKDAFEVAARIRFHSTKHPYVSIKWPNVDESLEVAVRLLYIKVEEERTPEDKKGALRVVRFQWQSSLFLSIGPDGFDYKENINNVLTEGIRIYLNTDNSLRIMNNETLIKTIQ